MNICIVNGSHRENSQSLKVANVVRAQLENGLCEHADIFSLAGNPLPLWDESVWDKHPDWEARLRAPRARLAAADGFVIISPEWHGQVPAGLKNFFLLFGRNELGHKPALIITVSSGDGGSYPVAELRMSSYKNSRICYIPEQVIVRHVEQVLNQNPHENDARSDPWYRERINWSLQVLISYAKALRGVRESGISENDKFRNGM